MNLSADYRKDWLRADVVAGFTAAAVVIPKAMAYATIAGLPVQVGLYTAFLPMLIYAALGTSRPLSVSTTTTIAILTGAELSQVAGGADIAALLRASAMLTLLVGGFLVLASVLRLGFIANFISAPVLVGFKAGIGLVIVLDQIPKILGIHFPKSSFPRSVLAIFRAMPETSWITLAVGIATIILLVSIERWFTRAPAPLIAVAAGIAGASLLPLSAQGVSLVGRIPTGLPPITLPEFSLALQLWPGALGIALMSFTETIAVGRAFAESNEPAVRANRELLATGAANVGGAFLGAMPGGGGTSQTAVNRLAGARTQLAEVVTSFVVLATMLLLSPFIGRMPQATLAAVIIVYSIGLIQPLEFAGILKVRRTEFTWAVTALGGVVLLGTLKGILVAIIVSLVALAYQVTSPPVYVLGRKPKTNVFRTLSNEHPEDETFPGLLLLRIEGRVFFANAEIIGQKMRTQAAQAEPKVIAIDFSNVPDLEYTALKMLTEGEKKQRERGVSVWLVGLNPNVLEVVRRSPLGEALGREGLLFNLELAVEQYLALRREKASSVA